MPNDKTLSLLAVLAASLICYPPILLGQDQATGSTAPEMVIQMGHNDVIRDLACSPQGTRLATASMDGTIKLWDVKTGRLFRTLPGHPGGARATCFSLDGRFLYSGGKDGRIKTWNAQTGILIRSLESFEEAVCAIAIRNDGAHMAACSEDGTVRVWSTATGDQMHAFKAHANGALDLAYTPEGHLTTCGADGMVKIWHPGAPTPLSILAGHDGPVLSVAIHPEGKHAASGGEDGTVRVWDLQNSRTVWTHAEHEAPVQAVAFSSDGQGLISGGWDGQMRIWDAVGGGLLSTCVSGAPVGAVQAGPGGTIFSAGGDNQAVLWDMAGTPIRRFHGQGTWVYDIAMDAQGVYMASACGDGGVRLWDLSDGRMLRRVPADTTTATAVALSSDAGRLVTGGADGAVKVWETFTGDLRYEITAHKAWIYDVAIDPDNMRAASASADGTVCIWDLSTGKTLSVLEGDGVEMTAVAFTGDGQRVIASSGDGTVRIWNPASGDMSAVQEGSLSWVYGIALSPGDSLVLSGGEDGVIRIWDAWHRGDIQEIHVDAEVTSLSMKGPHNAVVGTIEGDILWLDLEAGRVWRRVKAHERRITSVLATPTRVITASRDGSVKIWDAQGQEHASLMGFATGEWVTATPTGFYHSSIDGGRYVTWRIGEEVFPFDRYETIFRNPEAVRKQLQRQQAEPGGTAPKPPVPGQPPEVFVLAPSSGAATLEDTAEIQAKVQHSSSRISISATVNGRPAGTIPHASQDANRMVLPLVQGRNRIALIAIDKKGQQSEPDTVTIFRVGIGDAARGLPGAQLKGLFKNVQTLLSRIEELGSAHLGPAIRPTIERAKGDLWVLAVGVGAHTNPRFHLQFPPVDADSMAHMLEKRAGPLYRQVHLQVLTDERSTTTDVLGALEEISGRVDPQDVVMMFIAGHGVRTNKGEYYFITYDADPVHPSNTAFSWRRFEEILAQMPARNIVLFADTCHSGDIVTPGSRFAGTEEMAHTLVKESGVMVFVSSRGGEIAIENSAWGHGAFTYALLEGLRGKANYHADGVITMAEIQLYVPSRVRVLTRDRQHPHIPRLDNFDPEMPLVRVE